MIVCHCFGVSHREVLTALADGALSVSQIARRCGAARDCGTCAITINAMLREFRAERIEAAAAASHAPSPHSVEEGGSCAETATSSRH